MHVTRLAPDLLLFIADYLQDPQISLVSSVFWSCLRLRYVRGRLLPSEETVRQMLQSGVLHADFRFTNRPEDCYVVPFAGFGASKVW